MLWVWSGAVSVGTLITGINSIRGKEGVRRLFRMYLFIEYFSVFILLGRRRMRRVRGEMVSSAGFVLGRDGGRINNMWRIYTTGFDVVIKSN